MECLNAIKHRKNYHHCEAEAVGFTHMQSAYGIGGLLENEEVELSQLGLDVPELLTSSAQYLV